jgi:hypothetical protein
MKRGMVLSPFGIQNERNFNILILTKWGASNPRPTSFRRLGCGTDQRTCYIRQELLSCVAALAFCNFFAAKLT